MKNSKTVRSSVLGVVLLLISASSTFGQTPDLNHQPANAHEFPTAKVTLTRELNTTWYAFSIIHEIPEWKAERLEERLLLRYDGLENITIDVVENQVSIEVANSADSRLVSQILYHFKYDGYEEL